jgi:uncharacterized protein (TIGR02145 family)
MKKILIPIAIFSIFMAGCQLEEIPDASGSVDSVNCGSATVNGAVISGQPASNVTVSVPYSGGNGGAYSGQTVMSTGVTGLDAKLDPGSFKSGDGTLSYTVTGTPLSAGTASFALNVGGQTCTLSVTVQALSGTIGELNCSSATVSGSLTSGQVASGIIVTVPYSGGNGGAHSGQTVMSTGVTDLTATLASGSFASGSGNLTYIISGTPSGSGTADFALNIGGKTCTLSVPVQLPAGTVSALKCTEAEIIGNVWAGVTLSGVTLKVPYIGGNGGSYTAQQLDSDALGLGGLKATLPAGNFANGDGSVTYTLSGKASTIGTAIFLLNLGGKSCNVSVSVVYAPGCGAFIAPGEWKTFSCYNLGSSSISADPFTPSWEINGGYWQWGRSVQAATGPSGSGSSEANEGNISGWNLTVAAADGSWTDNFKTSNDPCPAGFRVPTQAQWNGVIANNTRIIVGTNWAVGATNYSTGVKFGNNLFLPAAGGRDDADGVLFGRGYYGFYWSSTELGTDQAWNMYFFSGTYTYTGNSPRRYGRSVRCIAE